MVAHTISAAFVVNTTTDVSTKSSTFAAKKTTWNNYTKNPLKMLSVTMYYTCFTNAISAFAIWRIASMWTTLILTRSYEDKMRYRPI